MKITANSKTFELEQTKTISEFIKSLDISPERCVVEYNGKALRFAQFADIELREGDKLEIMKVVAGG